MARDDGDGARPHRSSAQAAEAYLQDDHGGGGQAEEDPRNAAAADRCGGSHVQSTSVEAVVACLRRDRHGDPRMACVRGGGGVREAGPRQTGDHHEQGEDPSDGEDVPILARQSCDHS